MLWKRYFIYSIVDVVVNYIIKVVYIFYMHNVVGLNTYFKYSKMGVGIVTRRYFIGSVQSEERSVNY